MAGEEEPGGHQVTVTFALGCDARAVFVCCQQLGAAHTDVSTLSKTLCRQYFVVSLHLSESMLPVTELWELEKKVEKSLLVL